LQTNSIRRFLYKFFRILGDVNAIKRGTAGRRIGRRVVRRGTGKMIRKLFK
jgi:hypothetical protein